MSRNVSGQFENLISALDRLSTGDAADLLIIHELFFTQVSSFYYKYQSLLACDLDEFVLDRLFELGAAWGRTRERGVTVQEPVHWSRRVLRNRSVDCLKRSDEKDTVRPAEITIVLEDTIDSSVDVPARRAFVLRTLQALDYEIRQALYLTESEELSQSRAAKRLLESDSLPRPAKGAVLKERGHSPAFADAKCYLLSDEDAALLSMNEDSWLHLLREHQVAQIDANLIRKHKSKVANRVRKGRFRFHRAAGELLPDEPEAVRALWLASWPNESVAPKSLRQATFEHGFSEADARSFEMVVEIHVGFLLSFVDTQD